MSTTEWHVDTTLWQAYKDGRLDAVAEASIDAHVVGCATCRGTARALVEPAPMEALWKEIQADVRRPELPWSLRWLRRFGLREDDLVILAASDGFLLPWAMAVGGALLSTLLSVMVTGRQTETFLLLAPLVPVFAVVAAFDATEDLRDVVRTSPYSKLRLMLLRTVSTLALALPATVLLGVAIPGLDALAFASILPALALTSAVLVLLTWLDGWVAAGAVTIVWVAVVGGTARFTDPTILMEAPVQLALAAVLVALSVALVLRTTSYRLLGGEG